MALVGIFIFGGHEARSQNLYVGSNTSSQTTNFNSGTNSYSNTYVGYGTNASNNALNIFNDNTLLTNSASLVVGNGGLYNTLFLNNGASAISSNLVVGGSNSLYYSGNTVLVSGMGTNGSDAKLYVQYGITVGSNSSGNCLIASNGGQVTAYGGLMIGNGGNNNTVIVTGYDASNNPSTILAQNTTNGLNGSYNTLIVSNGGVMNTGQLVIGAGGTSNSVIVSGGVLNAYSIIVSARNSLVWNGGTIDVDNGLGVISVSGGTLVLNAPATNPNGLLTSINLNQSGSNIPTLAFSNTVGASSGLNSINTLAISGSAILAPANGAQLNVRSLVSGGSVTFDMSNYYETGTTPLINLSGSSFTLPSVNANGDTSWSFTNSGNSIAAVYNQQAYNADWSGDFYVGQNGNPNIVDFYDANPWGYNNVYVDSLNRSNCILNVANPGTVLNVGGDLFVGGNSSTNLLKISNGGAVSVYGASFGVVIGNGSALNSVLVTGTDSNGNPSTLNDQYLLYIGYGVLVIPSRSIMAAWWRPQMSG